MKTIKTAILITVASVLVLLASSRLSAQSPGIECGCETYGDYAPPASKAILTEQGTTVQEGQSENGKYSVVITDAMYPNIVNITIKLGNTIILNVSSRATGWGFSPDEDRFVMHGFDIHNKHWYTLYNLNPDPSVTGEQAEAIVDMSPTDVSSASLRFSPHGKYLLYGAIGSLGYLVLYIHNAVTGEVAYHPAPTLIVGSPSGKSVAGWGFSPDKRDRTFVHAMLSNASTYTLMVKNLEKPSGEYVLHATGNTGGANFRFSPCGDYFLWTWEDDINDPTCFFYKTSEENISPDETGSGIDMIKAYTKADGHYIKYFNGDVKIFDNTSDTPCDDNDPPVWSGASLTASNVTGTRCDLSWDAATDSKGSIFYGIFRDGVAIAEVENITNLTVTGLTPETSYTFKVEASDEAGNRTSDGPSTNITTLSDNPPAWSAATLTATDVEGVKMTLEWTGATDDHDTALTYRIFVDGDQRAEIYNAATYQLTGLTPSTSYTLKVEARDEAGQWTNDGPQLVQATATDNPPYWPGGAEITADTVTESSIEFQWTAAQDDWGVTGYEIERDGELIKTVKSYVNTLLDENLEEGTVYHYTITPFDEAGNKGPGLREDIKTISSFVVLPLIIATGNQILPDIDDMTIVWQDKRSGNDEIYVYDLETETEDTLISEEHWQGMPVVSGKRYAWADARNLDVDIYAMYPSAIGQAIKNITNDPGVQTIPEIDGTRIVWASLAQGADPNDWDIYMYDLETMEVKAICTAAGKQTNPSISGGIIVWEDYRNGNPDIYGYKLYYDEEFEVCVNDYDQTNPVVDNYPIPRIFWQDNRGGNWDIYMWTISYDIPWILRMNLGNTGNQVNPHAADQQLVYQDDRNGNWDIYAYQFSALYAGEVKAVCIADSNQVNPRTSKGRIVWEDYRNGDPDIYIWDRPPGADLAIEVSESADPVSVGKTLKYTLTAQNDGPDTEDLAKVVCELPVEAQFSDTAVSQGTLTKNGLKLTWDVGCLPYDSTATLEVSMKTYTITKLRLKAEISGTGFDPDPSNNRIDETTYVKEVVGQIIGEGYMPSMHVQPSGMVDVFYAEDDSTVHAFKNLSGSWQYSYLDTISEITSSDIIRDSDGYLHVAYADNYRDFYPSGWLYYSTNRIGNEWKNSIIALSDSGFYSIAAGINDRGNIHMLYQQASGVAHPGPFKYMNYKSGSWSRPELLDPSGYDHIDMVLDGEGFAHTVYIAINMGPVYRKSNDTIINSWSAPELVESGWGGGQLEGMVVDIAVDSMNNPHVVYPGNTGSDYKENIKYATKRDGIWHVEQVDEGSFSSGANAIVVEPSGVAHISYIHFPTGEVRYATNAEGQWIIQTIDQDVNGWLNELDMGIDAFGNIHILYENENIKYVKRPPAKLFTVDPDTLDFGVVKTDSTATRHLKFYNPGSKTIIIDSVSIIEEDGFTVPDFIEKSLYPDTEDSIAIVFSPETSMKVETLLRIFFNGASQMFMDIPVKATTPIQELTVTPDPVSFGYVDLGATEVKSVVLTNTGSDELVISDINVKYEFFGGEIDTDFDLESHNCTVLAPGESCSVQISLTPTKTGSHFSYLNIYSNDPENSYRKVTLTGMTSAPQINVEFYNIDFGSVIQGLSSTQTLNIYNVGQLDLSITNTTLTGTDAAMFGFTNPCTTIAPGDSCEMEVTFSPSANGEFNALLNIYSNSQYNNPVQVSLTGMTLMQALEVSPESIDFGVNRLSARDSMVVVTITNTGISDMTINSTSITGADMYEFRNIGCSGTLPFSQSYTDTVWFSPLFPGEKRAVLRIISNDYDEPVKDIPLTGTATEDVLYSLSGSVFDEDGLTEVTNGKIELLTSGVLDPVDSLIIDGSNNYSFTDLVEGYYTVKFIPDTSAYPNGLPTYLRDALTRAGAIFATLNHDFTGLDINMVNKPEEGTGEGEINGNLIEDQGDKGVTVTKGSTQKSGNGLNRVYVYLIDSGTDELSGYSVTDTAGYFEFGGLDNASYKFIADYNGIPMNANNPLLTIDQDIASISILSTVYTDDITVQTLTATGIDNIILNDGISVYPNPVSERLNIIAEDGLFGKGNVSISLQDIQGRTLLRKNITFFPGSIEHLDLSDIPSGIYILKVFNGEISRSVQVVKLR